MTPTRPLFVVHYNHTGVVAGAERVLLNALPGLASFSGDLDESVHSLVLSPEGPLQTEAHSLGISTQLCHPLIARFTLNPRLLAGYLRSFVTSIRSLRRDFTTLNPDLIHANSVRAGLVATCATMGLGIPVLWHIHDTLPSHPISWAIRAAAALSRRTRHIAVSRATARTFAGSLWRSRLAARTTVLHNVNTGHSTPLSAEARLALRQSLGIEGRFAVACIGQICTRKNQTALVEQFAEVVKLEPTAVLLIVGASLFSYNAPYEDKLRQRIHDLQLTQSVHLLGKRNDVPALLQAVDVLALPSLSEPFGMIILESMAAALPVIAFAVDGVPEVLADGQTGWLIPTGDNLQMLRKLVWAARNPGQRARIGQAAARAAAQLPTAADYARSLATTFLASAPIRRARAAEDVEDLQPAATLRETL